LTEKTSAANKVKDVLVEMFKTGKGARRSLKNEALFR
jgi:hypothetical protein